MFLESAARSYLKSSPQEDNLILEAINMSIQAERRGDYFSILQYVTSRIHVLSPSLQNFYFTSTFEQQNARVYRRQKSLLDSRKTIEEEWVQCDDPHVPTAFQAPMQEASLSAKATSTNVQRTPPFTCQQPAAALSKRQPDQVALIKEKEQRYVFHTSKISSPAELQSVMRAANAEDVKEREEREKRKLEEDDNDETQPPKKKSMKDIRKENVQMVNETLRSFPTMMTSMMEMMDRQRKEEREFKLAVLKAMNKSSTSDDE